MTSRTQLSKKLLAMGIDPRTHWLLPDDLHPDFIRLQAVAAKFFAKLNSRATTQSALPFWPNDAYLTTATLRVLRDAFKSYDDTVDHQQLTRDVTMTLAQPGAGGSGANWTVCHPALEGSGDGVITASTVSSQFGRINNTHLGEQDDDQLLKELLE